MTGRDKGPIVIGGCPRSGTTLLRILLDSHPDIVCGPEFKVIPVIAGHFEQMRGTFGPLLTKEFKVDEAELARTYGHQIETLLTNYLAQSGKRRIAEKTPQNIHVFLPLSYMLPHGYLVHVIRDGRDVVNSLLKQNWIDLTTGQPTPYTADIGTAERYWVQSVTDGRRVRSNSGFANYWELRYEDLVEHPERTLTRLLTFIGERWDDAVLDYHRLDHHRTADDESSQQGAQTRAIDRNAIGRWRGELSDQEKEIIKRSAGDLLLELRYCEDLNW